MSPSSRLPDAEARRLAQTEFQRPVVLEAGAGTGKTTTLVARILAWSLGPGWERAEAELKDAESRRGTGEGSTERLAARVLGGVVALTFTEAAAAEMAERAGRELACLAAGEPSPEWLHLETDALPLLAGEIWRTRAEALVSTLDHLTVTTIHAWCLGLLSTYPLEAGLHPQLTVDADFRRVEEVVAETVETALGRAYAHETVEEGSEVFLDLAARGIGPAEIAEALGVLVREGVDPKCLDEDPGSPAACRKLYRRLTESGRELLQTAMVPLEAAPPKKAIAAQRAIRAVRDLLERLAIVGDAEEEPTPGALEDVALSFSSAGSERLKTWAKGRFTSTEADALGEGSSATSESARTLLDRLSHAADLERLSLAHRALGPLLRTARREMRSRGVVTFQDLLQGAADLLTGGPAIHRAIASRVRRRIDQLLVDEFQDTDALQCRILRALALEGPETERPGLFLVGDPKQSIYGWRNADLAAYGAFVRAVEEAGGTRRPLLTNFRSTPALLEEVRRIVEPVMQEETDFQPPFEPLLPSPKLRDAPPFSTGGRHAVEHWTSWHPEHGPQTRNLDADRVEAEAVARDLYDLHHTHDTSWRSMALLFRSTTQLEPYLEALRRVGVPFQVSGDRQYYRRREVIEVAALVRAVLDPGDHLALLTVLRSSMVGVPDAALLPLWRRDLPQRAMGLLGTVEDPEESPDDRLAETAASIREAAAEVPTGIPGLDRLGGWPDALIAALRHLALARRSFREDPVDVFVARLRDLFLPEPIEAARYLGGYRLANLERFFRRLAEGLEEGGDAGAVLRRLRRSVAEAQEVPENPPSPGTADAVQVLTVHGAKGLEFEQVYLVQLHRASGGGGGPGTEVLRGGEDLALRLLGAAGVGFAELDERRRRVEEAEQVRLLYVAVTRAKQRLVLAGSPGGSGFGRGKPITALLAERRDRPEDLGDLWNRAVEAAKSSTGQESPEPHRDAAGVLWRFPALEPARSVAPAAQDSTTDPAAALPDASRVARDARRLAERRVWAMQRQQRPLSGPASEEAHDRLRDLLGAATEESDAATPHPPEPGERLRRMEVGSALHAALEQLDLERLALGEVQAELDLRRKAIEADLARRLPEADLPAARERALDLLARFAEGSLLDRLIALADAVIARELPVLLPIQDDDSEADPGKRPLAFVAGAIDLLYQDPEEGDLVVVDFKTDAVETDQEILARAEVYRPQGEIYRRAVREALDLPASPRVELWFLHPGRIVGLG